MKSRPEGGQRIWKSAAAAVVAVTLAACSGTASSVPVSGQPARGTVAAPSATAPASASLAWHRVTATPARGFVLVDVVPGGPGVVAVGTGGERGPGMAWESSDGSTWTDGPATDPLATVPLTSVAAAGRGLVAFGTDCPGSGECLFGTPVAVHAPPAGAWAAGTLVAASGALPKENWGAPVQIATTGPRFVAVGYALDQTASAQVFSGLVWISADGVTWHLLSDAPTFDKAEMLSVTYARGEYVAVGAAQAESGFDACVWISSDGLTWTREPDSLAFNNGTMLSVTAGGPGFVAVGTSPTGAAVWTSSDAQTWTREPATPDLANAQMHGVAAGSNGLVAVGYDDAGAIVWHSTDGVRWTREPTTPDFADAQALSVAALGDRYVAVGGASPNGTTQAYVWVGK